jgi:hypothetical protein
MIEKIRSMVLGQAASNLELMSSRIQKVTLIPDYMQLLGVEE